MPTFRTTGQLDDPYVEDGDPAFTGLDQQTEPVLLQSGMVQTAENVRFDRGVISTRGGLEAVQNFGGLGMVKFSDPNSDLEDLLVIQTNKIRGVTGDTDETILFPYETNDQVFGVQAFEQVLLFSDNENPKTWSGVQGSQVQDLSRTPLDDAVNFVCPPAPFGNYISNRLVVPYYADSTTTIAFSDLLQPNQFTLTNTFYCNKGTSDRTLAVCPYPENQAIIANRESLHIVSNCHALGVTSTNFEITRQYGIAGHKAYAQNGSYIYFISNEGNIHVIVPSSDPAKGMGIAISKATLDQEPLSKPITPTTDQIDPASLPYSIAHYHRNKVYFAFGIGSANPNTIAVYDSLISQWVSIDTFPDGINIVDINSLNDSIYILTDTNVFKYGSGSSDNGTPIQSKFRTRDFILNSRDIKNFTGGSLSYVSSAGASTDISVHTRNPDSTTLTKSITSETDETTLSRFNVSQRGYSASIEVNTTNAPSKFKATSLEAFATTRTIGDF